MKNSLIVISVMSLAITSSYAGTLKYKNNQIDSDTVFATYKCNKNDRKGIESIILYTNGRFHYSFRHHIYEMFSSGKWVIENKILLLNSIFQKDDLPIKILLNETKSNTEYGSFEWIRNSNRDILKDAQVRINYDTLNSCMPIFEAQCKFKRKEIQSIQVKLSNNVTSKWYKVQQSEKLTNIVITADIDFPLESFVFFDNVKFMLSGNKLYATKGKTIYVNGIESFELIPDKKYYFNKVH